MYRRDLENTVVAFINQGILSLYVIFVGYNIFLSLFYFHVFLLSLKVLETYSLLTVS